MNKNFKANERELVNVVKYFKRKSKALVAEGKIDEQHLAIAETVDRFVEQMSIHADMRATILDQRSQLQKIIKDDAVCPRCHTRDMIKVVGTEKNEKGWKSNRYKCRKCNIQFTWNMPNNPWDLLAYIQEKVVFIEGKLSESASADEQASLTTGLENTRQQLEQIKPVIDNHDKQYQEMNDRDEQMEKLIHDFKNTLLIEKIKMDTWENKKKTPGK